MCIYGAAAPAAAAHADVGPGAAGAEEAASRVETEAAVVVVLLAAL